MSRLFFIFLFVSFASYSQETTRFSFKWLRSGLSSGYANQDKLIKMDSDYQYENISIKWTNHFFIYRKNKYVFEFLVEPSYYRSKQRLINYWSIGQLKTNTDEMKRNFMLLKDINEFSLNLGAICRYQLNNKFSIYGLINAGPTYFDTDTERLAKGFAFSDIFAVGINYRLNNISFDLKPFFRHVSNANLQKPNFGLHSVGIDFAIFYELQK